MATLKKLSIFSLVGALLGVVLATLAAPSLLSWYNQPGTGSAALCNCAELVRETATGLIKMQLGGGASGAVLFLILGILWVRRKPAATATPAAVTPPAASPPPPG